MLHQPFRVSVIRGASRIFVALLLGPVAFAGISRGQTVVNFGDLSLPSPDSYWSGSDGSGGFTSSGAYFNNSYDMLYGAWSGWAYSNVNDTTTPGYDNQYAAFAGTAPAGSGNYAVAYVGDPGFGGAIPTVTIPDGMHVQSAMFTNTTLAALSMRDGDQFAKQFGPSDWFLLTITGENASGGALGSVNFYLAQNGSITSTWQTVDLGSLATARSLDFSLTSSDSGLYGMNTPAYFAMGSLTLTPANTGETSTGGTWTNPAGGSWGRGANWFSGTAASGGTIVFAGSTSGTAAVTLDGNRSASALQFGGASAAASYAIGTGTGGTLTLGDSAGGSVVVAGGTHSISAPIVLAGSLAVSTSGRGSIDISGNLGEATGQIASLTLTGDGELTLNGSNSYTGGTTVSSGTLMVTNLTALPVDQSLSVESGGAVIFSTSLGLSGGPSSSVGQVANLSRQQTAVSFGQVGNLSHDTTLATVPEPGTLVLMIAGAAWAFAWRLARVTRAVCLLAGGIVIVGCGRYAPSEKTGNRELHVVSLAPSATEILFELAAEDCLIGVTDRCDYPPKAQSIERVGGFGAPNVEKVLAMSPSLVVATGFERPEVAELLRSSGTAVLDVQIRDFNELCTAIRQIGDAVGKSKRAEAVIARMQAELEAVAAAGDVQQQRPRPKVFVEIGEHPLITAGRNSFLDDMITRAGGVNAAHEVSQAYASINPESVIAWNPDFIVVAPMDGTSARTRLADRVGWSDISAVKHGRVIDDIPADLLFRPGPRLVEGVKELAVRLRSRGGKP